MEWWRDMRSWHFDRDDLALSAKSMPRTGDEWNIDTPTYRMIFNRTSVDADGAELSCYESSKKERGVSVSMKLPVEAICKLAAACVARHPKLLFTIGEQAAAMREMTKPSLKSKDREND